jgi:hypothetical protein
MIDATNVAASACSGGPLLNDSGHVIAIMSLDFMASHLQGRPGANLSHYRLLSLAQPGHNLPVDYEDLDPEFNVQTKNEKEHLHDLERLQQLVIAKKQQRGNEWKNMTLQGTDQDLGGWSSSSTDSCSESTARMDAVQFGDGQLRVALNRPVTAVVAGKVQYKTQTQQQHPQQQPQLSSSQQRRLLAVQSQPTPDPATIASASAPPTAAAMASLYLGEDPALPFARQQVTTLVI